jgi:hypothetical protein
MLSDVGQGRDDSCVGEAELLSRSMGSAEFFLSPESMGRLLQHIIPQATTLRASLNRPQAGGKRLVHSVEWKSMRFVSASEYPLLLV